MASYAFDFQGHGVYTPDGKAPEITDTAAHNRAIESAELAHWRTAPDRMIGYYKFAPDCRADSLQFYTARTLHDCSVTTWTGAKLGTITAARVYRHNFGGRVVSLRMIGTNGAEYHGRASWDNGTIIRLRKAKH